MHLNKCQEPGSGPFRESCKYFCDSDSCNSGGLDDNDFTTVAPTPEPEDHSTVDCTDSDCQMNEETESALAKTYGEGKFRKWNYSKAVNEQVFKYLSCITEL